MTGFLVRIVDQKTGTKSRPCKDTWRRWSSTSQKEETESIILPHTWKEKNEKYFVSSTSDYHNKPPGTQEKTSMSLGFFPH